MLNLILLNLLLIAYPLWISIRQIEKLDNNISAINLARFLILSLFGVIIVETMLGIYNIVKYTDISILANAYSYLYIAIIFFFAGFRIYCEFDYNLNQKMNPKSLNLVSLFGIILVSIFLAIKSNAQVPNEIDELSWVQGVGILLLCASVLLFLLSIIFFLKKSKFTIFAFVVGIIAMGFAIYLFVTIPSASIYAGATGSTNIVSVLFFEILNEPAIQVTIVFMVIGGIPRSFPFGSKSFIYIGNLLIAWMPLVIWLMMFTRTIPVPPELLNLFANSIGLDAEFFAYIFFVLMGGVVFAMVIAIIVVFTNLVFDY
jgi:hypothetical protein